MIKPRITLGWREWIALPELQIPAVMAKIDTGARTSALHVDEQWEFIEQGAPWVGFKIACGNALSSKQRVTSFAIDSSSAITVQAPIHDRRAVRDSGGKQGERIFLLTRLQLGGIEAEIEINLCQRGKMAFPMLLGRTAMRRRFVVDPARSFLSGKDAPSLFASKSSQENFLK